MSGHRFTSANEQGQYRYLVTFTEPGLLRQSTPGKGFNVERMAVWLTAGEAEAVARLPGIVSVERDLCAKPHRTGPPDGCKTELSLMGFASLNPSYAASNVPYS